jgi:hypothetical protein
MMTSKEQRPLRWASRAPFRLEADRLLALHNGEDLVGRHEGKLGLEIDERAVEQ